MISRRLTSPKAPLLLGLPVHWKPESGILTQISVVMGVSNEILHFKTPYTPYGRPGRLRFGMTESGLETGPW